MFLGIRAILYQHCPKYMIFKRAYIIDVDNTLIDTEGIKSLWKNHFKLKFITAYNISKKDGILDIETLAKNLSTDPAFFYNTPFKKYLFKYSINALSRLKKNGRVIVLSLGDKIYQPLKIKNSGIEKVIGKSKVFIVQNKNQGINRILTKLQNEGVTEYAMVDDVAANFERAIKVFPRMINVWIRYGKYKNKFPLIKNIVTQEVSTILEASEYLTRLITVIKVPNTGIKLSVLKGLSKEQVKQLLIITKIDRKIAKFTHDLERFKNIKSISTWKNRGKTIYTLIDKNGKLRGIIWFSKKAYGKYKYTFAIRVYKPIRGKGVAKKFMKVVFDDFLSKNKTGIWLKTDEDNKVAISLYSSFGFKSEGSPTNGSRLMTYSNHS